MAGSAPNSSVVRMKPSGTRCLYEAICFSPSPLKPRVIWSSVLGLGSWMNEISRWGS